MLEAPRCLVTLHSAQASTSQRGPQVAPAVTTCATPFALTLPSRGVISNFSYMTSLQRLYRNDRAMYRLVDELNIQQANIESAMLSLTKSFPDFFLNNKYSKLRK